LGGIVRELRCTPLAIGGTRDHVHMLLRLPCELAVADCLRVVKTNASRWVHEKWPGHGSFAWQAGYGAFSVSESAYVQVVEYIGRQEEHHRKMSFKEEFVLLLRKHGVDFDARYLWPELLRPLRGLRLDSTRLFPRLAPWATSLRPASRAIAAGRHLAAVRK
jgi:putative transposase